MKKNTESVEILLTPDQIKGKSASGHDASFVLDDSFDTYYQTPDTSSNFDYMRFLDIDLKGLYEITDITLFMIDKGYNHYGIYASETGEFYNKIASKNDDNPPDMENGDHFTFKTPVEAGYLRINLSYNSTGMQGNLAKLRIFGRKIRDNENKQEGIHIQDFSESKWKEEWELFENDSTYAKKKTLCEMRNMVSRVLGEKYKESFDFAFITAEHDTYEIENGQDGKIIIRGTNGVSMASGLHYYLRYFCKVDYNPLFASNMRMPDTLPMVPEKIVKETLYNVRYGFHVCAHSYTMAFWEWDKYEACLDWAAMCGINLMLHMVGQEEILRRTLSQFGYSDDEVKEYIPAPTYYTWGCRNMSGFGGPLPDNWFADRVELGRKIHDRMQTLGIKPVLRGYYGAVPTSFADKNPDAKVMHQGEWCCFTRPDTLRVYVENGERNMYTEVADAFYNAQKEIYGDVTNYFSADPFMEGGRDNGIDQAKMFKTIQNKMIEHNPDSIWVLQKWSESINDTRLAGLSHKENMLIMDIMSEVKCNTDLTEKNELPWVWGLLHEFGGKLGMEANVPAVSKIPSVLKNNKYMTGLGMTSESLGRCPMIYEMLWDAAWTDEPIDPVKWGTEYLKRRYGSVNEKLSKAWSLLLQSVYSNESPDVAESLINARPTEYFTSTSSWGRGNITYDVKTLEKVFKIYIDNYEEFKDYDCYRYDMVDIARQVLCNSSIEFHKLMIDAYHSKNIQDFEVYSTHFLNLIQLQNDILSTNDHFRVGRWIESARNMMSARDDWTKDMFEWNARCQITTWAGKRAADDGGLRDYSYRCWAGITEDYYLKRWAMWVDSYKKALAENTEPSQFDWFIEEWKWANQKSDEGFSYPVKGDSHKDLLALCKQAYDLYTVTNLDRTEQKGKSSDVCNLLLGKELSTKNNISKEDLLLMTDGNTATGWTGTTADWPLTFEYDFGDKTAHTEEIRLSLKLLVASGIPVTYKAEAFFDGVWTTLKEDLSGNLPGQIIIPCSEKMQKFKLTMDSIDEKEKPELLEIELIGTLK